MAEEQQEKQGISRRRLIAGAGVGAAAVWAAPTVTTLGSAAFAAGSCVKTGGPVFSFITASASPAQVTAFSGNFTGGPDELDVTQGNVDTVGPGTSFPQSDGYTSVRTIDLTGDGTVTTTEMTSPVISPLPSGAYIVEVDVYGSTLKDTPNGPPTNNPNNEISVLIGGTTVIAPINPPDGSGNLTTLTGSTASAGGTLTIHHVSPDDFQGLFLARIEVFPARCQ